MSSTTTITSSASTIASATASCINVTPDKNGYVPEWACSMYFLSHTKSTANHSRCQLQFLSIICRGSCLRVTIFRRYNSAYLPSFLPQKIETMLGIDHGVYVGIYEFCDTLSKYENATKCSSGHCFSDSDFTCPYVGQCLCIYGSRTNDLLLRSRSEGLGHQRYPDSQDLRMA